MMKEFRFDELIIYISENLTSEDRTKFRFIYREILPRQILETDEPLVWFDELERRGQLDVDNLGFLEDFLKTSDLIALVNVVKRFKEKRKLLVALRESKGRLHFVLPPDDEQCEPTTKQLYELIEITNSHLAHISNGIKIIAFVGGLALVIVTARPYF